MLATKFSGRVGSLVMRSCYTFPVCGTLHVDASTDMPIVSKKGKGVIGMEYMLPTYGVVVAKKPMQVKLEAGKTYAWCCCGHSQKQPFCDGSHNRTAITELRPIRFKAEKTETVQLCMCRQTKNRPYCDGTHKKLPPGKAQVPIQDLRSFSKDEHKRVIKGEAYNLGLREKTGRFT